MKRLICILALLVGSALGQILTPILSSNSGAGTGPSGNTVSIPTASPSAPSYIYVSVGATVTLSDATGGATICYRTDGTNPAATVAGTCDVGSTTYSTGISVSTTTTIKALGTKLLYTNSSVVSFAYTVSSLVAEWKMADGSGTTVTDSCCGNNLTITTGSGGWSTLSGIADGVFVFTGSSTTHMDAANNTNINFNYNQAFSIFVVLEDVTTTEQAVIGNLDTGNNYRGWELDLQTGSSPVPCFFLINTYPSNAIQQATSAGISLSAVHDLLVTYDGGGHAAGVTFYVDGSSVSKASPQEDSLTTTTTNSKLARVGLREDATDYLHAYLGPVYLWNRVLTSGEASALHANFYNVPN